jgi:hypothetical protein
MVSTCQPITIASGEPDLGAIAVDATNVYWVNDGATGTVKTCPASGCAGSPKTIASMQDHPRAIAVDGTNVYWANYGSTTNDGTVMKVPIPGGNLTVLASNQGQPNNIALDTNNVYWSNANTGAYWKVSKLGAGAMQLGMTSGYSGTGGIAVDATTLFWTEWGTGLVQSVPTDGSANQMVVAMIAGPINLAGIALNGGCLFGNCVTPATSAYWAAPGPAAIWTTPLTGPSPKMLSPAPTPGSYPLTVAADATNVYWAAPTAAVIMSQPVGGGGEMALASGLSNPQFIAIDATSVYWTDSGANTVMKVAKP